jgi:DNA-binding NarL/FixJ family response regulator
MGRTRILLVDDHALIREAVAEILQREEDLEVVGTAANADDAIDLARRLCPNVLVMDIDMGGVDCFDAVRRIRAAQPEVLVLFLSAYAYDHYIERALRVGARGYVTKTSSVQMVVAAVREVAAGGACFSPDVQARLVATTNGVTLAAPQHTRSSTLTERELEVLGYVARGLSKKAIADLMFLSVNTVDRHTTNIRRKLGVRDRVALARLAIREGLVHA